MESRDRLLWPGEVAVLFNVHPRTVTRWAKSGRLPSLKTRGGQHRFRESVIRERLTVRHGGKLHSTNENKHS
ncbi:MerR family DNA-binding transcriptional regulator [Candidatus Saccharibacteria bacterium]|nr:MAG: MerR family DNA-binding transcriptional regulator [Candidatus Saccharibacteria bacterium]